MRTFLFAMLVISITACKKNDDPPSKDYTPLFRNTVWTGQYTVAPTQPEPYSIEFTASNAITLHVHGGDFPGSYTLEKNSITFSFASVIISGTTGNAVKISATIQDDNHLADFKNITGHQWSMINSTRNNEWQQDIDNTNWSGQTDGTYGAGYSLSFKPSTKVFIAGADHTYERKGGSLRISYPDHSTIVKTFCVLMADKTMKGVIFYNNSRAPFTLTKQ